MKMKTIKYLVCFAMISSLLSLAIAGGTNASLRLQFNADNKDSMENLLRGPYRNRVPGPRGEALAEYGGSVHSEMAVFRALRWLKHNQESNGCWRAESGGKMTGDNAEGIAPAMTGLALLAMLAHANAPADEEFGESVARGVEWLINNQKEDGHFKESDLHEYSLPIAASALCEAYALTGDPKVERAAKRSIWVIVNGQNSSGGWTYQFRDLNRNDTSFMSWCAQALFAAKASKLDVAGLDHAAETAVAAFARNMNDTGAFGYTSPLNIRNDLTGAGVYSISLLGSGRDINLAPSLKVLSSVTCDWQKPWSSNPLYHWHSITQAKFYGGSNEWNSWNKVMCVQLVRNQVIIKKAVPHKDRMVDIGFWESPSDKEHCQSRVYATALCTLMLETYYRHKPRREIQKEE